MEPVRSLTTSSARWRAVALALAIVLSVPPSATGMAKGKVLLAVPTSKTAPFPHFLEQQHLATGVTVMRRIGASGSVRRSGKVAALGTALAFFTGAVNAGYDANLTGVVMVVATFEYSDKIFVQLANQPTSHPACDPSMFAIAEDVPQNRRNQLFAQLLAAKESGKPVNIGYDSTGNCAYGHIRVHRVG